jgi:hypothetical protein
MLCIEVSSCFPCPYADLFTARRPAFPHELGGNVLAIYQLPFVIQQSMIVVDRQRKRRTLTVVRAKSRVITGGEGIHQGDQSSGRGSPREGGQGG